MDPIKLIWKYKNNSKRINYNLYIFIGQVPKNIMKVLEKIESLNFYDTLITLNKQEYQLLEEMYGKKWYLCFFNTYHINSSIYGIKDSSSQKNELIEKYGKQWYSENIETYTLIEKKLIYSYESLIKDERMRKNIKKGKMVASTNDDEVDIDYTTTKKIDVKKLFDEKINKFNRLKSIKEGGGDDDLEENEEIIDDDDDNENDNDNDNDNGEESADMEENTKDEEDIDPFEQGDDINEIPRDDDEKMDMDEIEQMYKDVDVNPDSDLVKTSIMIKQALDDEKLFEKKINQMVDFDASNDNGIYDESLKNVYNKKYVITQYIYKDDTIKAIKDKICCGIKNNSKFGKDAYLIPSRQYLWSEYYFDNKIEKIMLGQKWMKRNELLNVDIEPNNNIRFYEELIGQLKVLKDKIRREGNKIRRDDDENNILYDYNDYILNNEIYMIDIYNKLGLGYNSDIDSIKNLQDVYLKLYFTKIKTEDLKYIIDYLNNDKKIEINKITTVFETVNNDLIMENEIMSMVESVKLNDNYKHIFKENYITQSVIHLNLRLIENTKIDLYRIFNEFEVSEKYPFIQYQTPDGNIVYKFSENEINNYLQIKENSDVLSKWFENAPYGISFKVKIKDKSGEKFMAITLNENGRIEYKTQWKEVDMATIDDIKITYGFVNDLITKLNNEKNNVKFDYPESSEFKFAFINTIQGFELPDKFSINHNDLSEFSRYFYPYIALVIEPRKRQAKVQKATENSKFGTYVRYKRVSKYENQARLEQRIMYFIRNYEFTDQALANEISKQFNITEERAFEEVDRVRSRYPNLKKSRKVLKKLENIPKYKPPGIGIDIQGKQTDKYKIRISGARDKDQLDRMILFMNILIYLYIETYLYKKPEKQILKEKLKKLTKIAKRRNKVDELVDYAKGVKTVKQMTQSDKLRIGFKPDKGGNQWTRSCQNSGDDKKRRPKSFTTANIEEMLKWGYQMNKKTGMFEKKVMIKGKGGKKQEIVLKTIKLPELDEEGNTTDNEIHYTCNPEENGDHYYVGFLTRSMNPNGLCMPCCFKKDPMISKNKEKRKFFLKCLGNIQETQEHTNTQKVVGDRLYILQDTNKIQEGRFGDLPKYLDFYFNTMLGKQKKIKHHYLIKTDKGYFFKYGSKQDSYQFLNAIASLTDLTLDQIKNKMIETLLKDKNEQIFTSLNNGDIKTQFSNREQYIQFIKNNGYLDFDMINSLLSIPGVIVAGGLNIIIFQKKITVIKKTFEKEKIREDFTIGCQNTEDLYNLTDPNRQTLIMMKENKNYYPIILVKKDNENTKNIEINKIFNYENKNDNIVHHILDFFSKNCHGSFMDVVAYRDTSITAKELIHILISFSNKEFHPKYQIIDVRNKCKYVVTNNNLILPTRPSGSLYNIQIVKTIDRYILGFNEAVQLLNELYKLSDKKIPVKPFGVYYDEKHEKILNVTGITTKTRDVIPIKSEKISTDELDKLNLIYENKPLTDKIDLELLKGNKNYKIDNRILSVNFDKYQTESYELFRLEFSDYINRAENVSIKSKIENIMLDNNINRKDKVDKLRLIIYRLIDKDLYDKYKKIIQNNTSINIEETNIDVDDEATTDTDSDTITETNSDSNSNDENISDINKQTGGKYDKLLHIATKVPELVDYQVENDRNVCVKNKDKGVCNKNPHCHWTHSGCYMSLTKDMIIMFVNKISEDLALNDLKAFEIMKVGNYFVSDIVDYNKFTERNDQMIIRSSSNSIKKKLGELFGKDNAPKIGKRRQGKFAEVNYQQLNIDNPLIDMKDFYLQNIIEGNLTIFRAYVNGYYWVDNKYNDIESKNLGYYSLLQTDLANYFRSLIIEWLQNRNNKEEIDRELIKFMDIKKTVKNPLQEFIIKLAQDIPTLTNCIIELYVLSKINHIPIVVLIDDNIKYIFDNGLLYNANDQKSNKNIIQKYKARKDVINITFNYITNQKIPDDINVIYYK